MGAATDGASGIEDFFGVGGLRDDELAEDVVGVLAVLLGVDGEEGFGDDWAGVLVVVGVKFVECDAEVFGAADRFRFVGVPFGFGYGGK